MDGAYMMAIMMQFFMFSGMILAGISELNESVGGVLLGEHDYSAFNSLIRQGFRTITVSGVLLMALILVFPQWVLLFFGDKQGENMVRHIQILRMISVMLLPYLGIVV